MGDHLLKRRERRVPGGNAANGMGSADGAGMNASASVRPTGMDFNFEQGLSGFDKQEEFNKIDENDNKAKGSYQKSSFFDTISCDALDRLEGKQGRITASTERKLNTETFGAVGLNNRRNYRGGRGSNRNNGRRNGGGGGGGGHRNGGRGGGQSGNNYNGNNNGNGNGSGSSNRNGNWGRGSGVGGPVASS